MPAIQRYAVPIPIAAGPGAVSRLGELLTEAGISRPFIVTDPGIRRAAFFERFLAGLGAAREEATIFDGVSPNPREEDVLAGLELYRSSRSGGIVAAGGGSAIDAAKAVRLLAAHPGTISDYDLARGGARKITEPLPPLIAVPTTAGTGSEVSRGALIITRRGSVVRKTIVASPRLVPCFAVLDPELTLELPPALTAGSGMDALSHAIEEHLSPRPHPVVTALALGAAAKIQRALPQVWREPADLEARGEMQMAAMMAGIGFEKGLGVVHSLSHAIGALHDIHHGTLNAVLLPCALELNREHCAPGTLEELAAAVGLPTRSPGEACERLVSWLRSLNQEMRIPERLRDLKDMASSRDEILARALEDHCHRTNPRPCGPGEMLELWERAW
jgi:4-hydroxybutyrate dehydrogenase